MTADPARGTRELPAPRPLRAGIEVLLALLLIGAGLIVPTRAFMFGSTPWLAIVASGFLWARRTGWGSLGLERPRSVALTTTVAIAVGVGYQLLGTYALEPLIARVTSGPLPDVSQFRAIVGNERELLYWIVIAWILAALLEELSFRGWLMTRVAELGGFGASGWIAGLLVTSAVFGAVHVYQGLSGIIATGLTGLVFGGLYLASRRNLWACVIAHGVLDTTGFVMMYLGIYPGL